MREIGTKFDMSVSEQQVAVYTPISTVVGKSSSCFSCSCSRSCYHYCCMIINIVLLLLVVVVIIILSKIIVYKRGLQMNWLREHELLACWRQVISYLYHSSITLSIRVKLIYLGSLLGSYSAQTFLLVSSSSLNQIKTRLINLCHLAWKTLCNLETIFLGTSFELIYNDRFGPHLQYCTLSGEPKTNFRNYSLSFLHVN